MSNDTRTPEEVFNDEQEELQDDLVLPGGEETPEAVAELEAKLISGRPVASIRHPSGKVFDVWPKAQGYFYKIEQATAEYIQALSTYERKVRKRPWFFARFRQKWAVDRIENAKYELFRLIFSDTFNKPRDQEFTVDEFMGMPHDVAVSILAAYRQANNVDDILRHIVPGYAEKKTDLRQETSPSGMRL